MPAKRSLITLKEPKIGFLNKILPHKKDSIPSIFNLQSSIT